MSLVGIEVTPGRRIYVWNIVCLVTPDIEWIHYYGVEFYEYLGIKGVLFVYVTK